MLESKKKIFLFLLIPVAAGSLFIGKETVPTASNETDHSLQKQIDDIINQKELTGATTGISIRSADTGEVIYSHQGDTRLHPASNMKLLTAVSALETLGEDYQFSTEILTDGEIENQQLHGNLYIKGKGDPTLMEADLRQFAKDLKGKGITKINGDIIGDDSWYDDVRLSQDLNWSDETNHTGAQISALTISPTTDYDAGTVLIEANPGADIGSEATITATPATDFITIHNETKTVAASDKEKLTIEREHGTNQIKVEGTLSVNAGRQKEYVAIWDPTRFVLDLFKDALEAEGITFSGQAVVKKGNTPDNATMLTKKYSIPLKEILVPFMKLSNNTIGETLTKEMGKVVHGEGSWEMGLKVMHDAAGDLGMNTNNILLRDGSGMSHKNLLTANNLTEMLYNAQEKEWVASFENSLPQAGHPDRLIGGTLRDRMVTGPMEGRVLAKTGTLTGVSTLSGYVISGNGDRFIFSIMINNHLEDSVAWIEDAIVTELAAYE